MLILTVQVSAGMFFSLFLTTDGHVLSCGRNDTGQCGSPGGVEKLLATLIEIV